MKNYFSSLLVLLLASIGAYGQVHTVQDVLNVRALGTWTNGVGITNLSILVTNLGMIYNPTNTTYTNAAGTYVGTATAYLSTVGTTNSSTTAKLFNDIILNPDRNGQPIATELTDVSFGLLTNRTYLGNTTLFVEYVNPLLSNAAWGITFRPVWDGETPSSYTGEDWGFRIAYGLVTKGSLATNLPTWKWPGARALRVVSVTNQLAFAGQPTNATFVTKVRAVTYRP